MSIKDIQEEIIEEFAMFDNWMQKYDYLIELSKDIPLISQEYRLNENLIKGCQSKVWLLIRVLSQQKAEDILENEMYFIDAIGLKEHLSMTRSNGLVSMIKQMKFYALAFQAK